MISDQVVRELAEFNSDGAVVTTCYLNVDGRDNLRPVDVEKQLETMVRETEPAARDEPSIAADLQRITAHVRSGFDRKGVRGLAMFSCAPREFWQVVPLPLPVHSRISVGHAPALGQLESVVQELRPIGVLLVDRQRFRLFVYQLGELTDHTEHLEELPRDYDIRDQSARGDTRPHVKELAAQHYRHAARAAFELFHERNVGRVSLGGSPEAVAEVEEHLHPYLKERLTGRLPVAANAPTDEVRSETLALQARTERAEEAAAVARLRDAVGAGQRGVAGLADTLEAVSAGRTETLLVSDGFAESGWRCPACSTLAAVGPRCRSCNAEMARVPDVVAEAVQETLAQSGQVEVCVGNADLDVMGRIGALLRY